MSEIQRYEPEDCDVCGSLLYLTPNGCWVTYENYAALAAQLEGVQKALASYDEGVEFGKVHGYGDAFKSALSHRQSMDSLIAEVAELKTKLAILDGAFNDVCSDFIPEENFQKAKADYLKASGAEWKLMEDAVLPLASNIINDIHAKEVADLRQRVLVRSSCYGDLVGAYPRVSESIEPHEWDNLTVSEQREWALALAERLMGIVKVASTIPAIQHLGVLAAAEHEKREAASQLAQPQKCGKMYRKSVVINDQECLGSYHCQKDANHAGDCGPKEQQ